MEMINSNRSCVG